MKTNVKVLLIEDDEDDVLLTKEYLEESANYAFEVMWESNLTTAKEQMLSGDYDLFLIDYRLGSENGLDLIKIMRDNNIITPAILLTGQGDLKVDIDASASGASDYLIKTELSAALLERSIRYALSQAKIVKELDEKEKKYRSLFERSIDALFLATDKLALTDVNDSFLTLFGHQPEEINKLSLANLFDNESDYDFFFKSLKENEQVKDFEVTLMTKAGTKKICLLNCIFIPDRTSDFCCYQGIVHDLTLRKQAEDEMLIAERLSLTGKIARTIAHEVRNPLTNLNLALDQLRDELDPTNDSAKLFGDIIERNANRIEQLIGEMLNSSKSKELQVQLCPIEDLVEETLSLALDRIKLHEIRLEKVYQPDMPRILADKEKIQIALLNIFINAVESMTPGIGILTIRTKSNSKVASIEVSDNGKGIPEEDVKKLFDPFFTSKKSGMGLGLTSTKNILNSHSALVEVQSEVGKGTTFIISFKLAE